MANTRRPDRSNHGPSRDGAGIGSSLDGRSRPATPAPRCAGPVSAPSILSLQGTVGNRATSTVLVQRDPPAAPAGKPVAQMTVGEKLTEAYRRANINAAVRQKIESALTPEAIGVAVVAFAAAFAASQLTPVGWAADIGLALTGVFLGSALFSAGRHLVGYAEARNATTDEQLDHAGREFAQAVAEVEIDALLLLLTHATGGGLGGAGTAYEGSTSTLALATTNGRLVVVAVESVPASVAAANGITSAAATTSLMSSTGSRGSGGSGPPRELTDDEKWEQAENARRTQEAQDAPPRGSVVAEAYDTVEAAIGQVEGEADEIAQGVTKNPGLVSQGYTQTRYVIDRNGTQWTVHYNPRTGKYTGAHHSSSND
jgi:hypothetical protein